MDTSTFLEIYRTMLRIRRFEERVGEAVEASEVKTPCHLYIGQEAIAAGVCATLTPKDTVWGGHRSHGHYLAKGGDLRSMMAEIYGKATGCSRGRGGSMHLFAAEVGVPGTVPLVAATIPMSVGAALAAKLRKDGAVAVAFFGDGAVEEGHCHESVNLAALFKLPVIFVCENNLYASHMSLLQRRTSDNIESFGKAHGVASEVLDGNDVEAVFAAARRAVSRAREGGGATFLECRTYRWRGHVGPDWNYDVGVRRRDELKEWLPKDPIARARRSLETAGIPPQVLDEADAAAKAETESAVIEARRAPAPEPSTLPDHVFVPRRP